jgi:hypothetical protein
MMEKCCNSMAHWEHMCSLTLNGCAIEKARSSTNFECTPCDDPSHNHRYICTPNIFGT